MCVGVRVRMCVIVHASWEAKGKAARQTDLVQLGCLGIEGGGLDKLNKQSADTLAQAAQMAFLRVAHQQVCLAVNQLH